MSGWPIVIFSFFYEETNENVMDLIQLVPFPLLYDNDVFIGEGIIFTIKSHRTLQKEMNIFCKRFHSCFCKMI